MTNNPILLNPEHYKFRLFSNKQIGKYALSIQASYMHYCKPRLTLSDINDYEEYEIDIFLNEEHINPKYDKNFSEYSWNKYWGDNRYDCGAFVPKKDLGNIIKSLKHHS